MCQCQCSEDRWLKVLQPTVYLLLTIFQVFTSPLRPTAEWIGLSYDEQVVVYTRLCCNLFVVFLLQVTVAAMKSYFTFVIIPLSISSNWHNDSVPAGTQIKKPHSAKSNQTYVTLAQLVATLANQPYADRVVNYEWVSYWIHVWRDLAEFVIVS